MNPRRVKAILLASLTPILCGCRSETNHCDTIRSACADAPDPAIASLMNPDSIDHCSGLAKSKDETACGDAVNACQLQCSSATVPDTQDVFGCWRRAGDPAPVVCFGGDHVPHPNQGAHSFAWWDTEDTSQPTSYSYSYEVMRPQGWLVLYLGDGTGNWRCAKVLRHGDAIYTSAWEEGLARCPVETGSPMTERWDRIEAPQF